MCAMDLRLWYFVLYTIQKAIQPCVFVCVYVYIHVNIIIIRMRFVFEPSLPSGSGFPPYIRLDLVQLLYYWWRRIMSG